MYQVPTDTSQLDSATFSSRAEFMAGQGVQASLPITQKGLWHNCQTVSTPSTERDALEATEISVPRSLCFIRSLPRAIHCQSGG